MTTSNTDVLVSTEWLADNMHKPDVKIVDGSYFMPSTGKKGIEEFMLAHIPGAQFFDIDKIAASKSALPHMVPSAEKFSSAVRKLGLGDGLKIVIYDCHSGAAAATRVWWMFRYFGATDVLVLDGGLKKWIAEGRPIEEGLASKPQERHFTARQNNFIYRDKNRVLANLETMREQVIDARSNERFQGGGQEPWPVVKSGSIPGSKNLPYTNLLDMENGGVFKDLEQLAEQFKIAGIDLKKPMISSCGSGVTACMLIFAAYLLGNRDVALYDGSWAEWGADEDTPFAASSMAS